MSQAEGAVFEVGGTMANIAGALVSGMAQARQQQAVRAAAIQANRAACYGAASGARAEVLADTVARLREDLADAVCDADDARAEAARLRRDVEVLKNYIRRHGIRAAA